MIVRSRSDNEAASRPRSFGCGSAALRLCVEQFAQAAATFAKSGCVRVPYGFRRPDASTATVFRTHARRRAFSVLEIMVAVALLAVIIVGLLAMFYQVQRAFRAGTSQVDVMEGGRAAISIITREMQEVAATGVDGATNLFIVPSDGRNLLSTTVQLLSSGASHDNFMQDLCFLQRRNDEWTGLAYRLTNALSGVGTLVRYSWSWTNDSNPAYREQTNFMMSRVVCTWPPNQFEGVSQVLDGVVHFQVDAYDADGRIFYNAQIPNSVTPAGYSFVYSNLPAYLDIELRVLEPATLAKFRARAENPGPQATDYLAKQIGHTHVFRQRIPVRSAATLPF